MGSLEPMVFMGSLQLMIHTPSELDGSVPCCIHTDGKRMSDSTKGRSRCSNKGPCAVGSVARSCTSHTSFTGCADRCGLHFIASERSIVKGLLMPSHSASKQHCLLLRHMFGPWLVLLLLPQSLSSARIIVWFADDILVR